MQSVLHDHQEVLFHEAFCIAPAAMAIVNLSGKFLQANSAMCSLLGYGQTELEERQLQSFLPGEEAWKKLALLAAGGEHRAETIQKFTTKSGREMIGLVNAAVVRDAGGAAQYFVVHLQNQTERHRVDAVESDRRQTLEMIAQDHPLPSILHQMIRMIERQIPGVWACFMLPQNGTMRLIGPSMPPALIELLKRRPVKFCADLSAAAPGAAVAPRVADVDSDPAWEGFSEDARQMHVQCCWAMGLTARDTQALGMLVTFLPVHRSPDAFEQNLFQSVARLATIAVEHHQTTRQLAHLVRHDPLTGLPNRIMFEDRLYHALTLARRHSRPLALLAMDLNHFKQVNDTLGHQAGDILLQQFAQRVRGKLRECDTLARVGGDEFLLILSDVKSREEAQMVADRVTRGLASAQFELAGHSLKITSSIGIAIFPADGDDAMQLQRAADAAMYKAKEKSRAQPPAKSA